MIVCFLNFSNSKQASVIYKMDKMEIMNIVGKGVK